MDRSDKFFVLVVIVAVAAAIFLAFGRARIEQGTTRALPALSGGLLYVRGRQSVKCLDLRPAE